MNNNVPVYITGEKDGFKSKSAIQKFKDFVKTSSDLELTKKYIKDDYTLSLVERTDYYIKYNIKQNEKKTDKERTTNLLKAKLKILADKRTNINVRNLSLNKDTVPSEIAQAYKELMKISHIPVPEPLEILKKPEMHKPLILDVLRNNLVSKLSNNHPYCNYFKLLAKHMKIENDFTIPNNILNVVDNQIKQSEAPSLIPIVENNTTESDSD
jgi:hypothetical protein